MIMTVYDFKVKNINGEEVALAIYRGKLLLIVNTASKCGFTPQYAGLQKLYNEYHDRGLEILGFPSNQFAEQEPGENEEVKRFCSLNYGVTFPLFAKGDVRGETAQPLFRYLTEQVPFKGFDLQHPVASKLIAALETNFPEFLEGDSIKWNFTKFLVDRSGNVVGRFEPTTEPEALKEIIERHLDR
jgi:glutathione peroxidase